MGFIGESRGKYRKSRGKYRAIDQQAIGWLVHLLEKYVLSEIEENMAQIFIHSNFAVLAQNPQTTLSGN